MESVLRARGSSADAIRRHPPSGLKAAFNSPKACRRVESDEEGRGLLSQSQPNLPAHDDLSDESPRPVRSIATVMHRFREGGPPLGESGGPLENANTNAASAVERRVAEQSPYTARKLWPALGNLPQPARGLQLQVHEALETRADQRDAADRRRQREASTAAPATQKPAAMRNEQHAQIPRAKGGGHYFSVFFTSSSSSQSNSQKSEQVASDFSVNCLVR
eukprot:GHVT01032466.1.p1 GENE.GHVT01032466.1~~GHVT01032466.1.p1  ORF type:complete len:220 (+),score=51.73 GHVT01032466.1:2539-3198(+)